VNEIHALSGAYAVDALDELERKRFESHLAECADCRAEVASLREAAALLPAISDQPPADAVRNRILAEIGTVRPLPPLAPAAESPARRRVLARFLVAAALIVMVAGTVVAIRPWHHEAGRSVAGRVLTAGDAVTREVTLENGGSVTLVRSRELGRAVLVTHDIAAPPSGRTYQLWLQDPQGRMHPAGLVDAGGSRTVVLSGDAADAIGAGITVEPAGGSPQPTTAPIALVGFGRA
jgi:anti-sigma-K factor RskA